MKVVHMNWMRCVIILVLLTALAGASYGQTVVVSPGNMNGWTLFTTDNQGNAAPNNGNIAQMVYGPSTPPLGVGSAELATAPNQGDSSANITTSSFDGTPLSSLTSLSYSTYCAANNGQQFPYLALTVSLDGTPTGAQDSLFFEPPYQTALTGNPNLPDQGATVMNEWQTWNALSGGWWDNNGNFNPGVSEPGLPGVNSLAAFLTLYPNATIEDNIAYPVYGGVALQVGWASPSDIFTGYVDNVTIGTASGTTTFDFEPVPEPSAVLLVSMGLMGMLIVVRRRKT